jgi:hypothetical protein
MSVLKSQTMLLGINATSKECLFWHLYPCVLTPRYIRPPEPEGLTRPEGQRWETLVDMSKQFDETTQAPHAQGCSESPERRK